MFLPQSRTHASTPIPNPLSQRDHLYRFSQERAAAFYQQRAPSARRDPPTLAAVVAGRLQANLASGRAQRLLGLSSEHWPLKPALLGYIDRLVRYSDAAFDLVVRLQASDNQAWHSLYETLRVFAMHTLVKTGMDYAFAAERAQEQASQTCLRIFQNPYPGDVDFMAWACRILLNGVRALHRSTDIASRFPDQILSLDRPMAGEANQSLYDLLPDSAAAETLERAEDRAEIMQLLGSTLGPLQRAIILATYFDERADIEIARALDSTSANVQVIRHRALRRLKLAAGRSKEWAQNSHNYE